MQSSVSAFTPISRPKIHRPPFLVQERRRNQLLGAVLSYGHTARFVFTFSSLALVAVLAWLVANHWGTGEKSLPAAAQMQAPAVDNDSGATIVLKDEKTVIIGKMARLSPPESPPAEVATMSAELDRRKGRELLSIISKY